MTDVWRLIDTGSYSATYNMALDEAIATAVRKDNAPSTLRFYGWNKPSVSIGCFQKINDIDSDYCIDKRITVVRRPTGGRAILHDKELTYSISVKTTSGTFSKGLLDSYKKISKAFSLAFSRIGLTPELTLHRETRHVRSPLCFQSTSYGEITINKMKVIGSAQKRWSEGLLQQGSIPYLIDKDEMIKIFRLKSLDESMDALTGLNEIIPELNTDDFKNTIRIGFEETFDVKFVTSSPSQEELSLADELEVKKYLSSQWNFQR
ncbi:MAG: lipoate--protein ligase family protein [Nitrospira sp.]|nr:lipoate--protein ligase family protein [Nitrospira sp.]